MSTVVPLSQSSKRALLFVTISYGPKDDPFVIRVTNWSADAELNGFAHVAMPDLQVEPIHSSGTLNERGCKMTMRMEIDPATGLPLDEDDFLHLVSNGEPFPPTFVAVDMAIREAGGDDVVALHRGQLYMARRNVNGRADLVSLESHSWKGQLGVGMGIPITHLCWSTLGGKGCFLPGGLKQYHEQGVIESVDGATATITGLASHGPNRYWHRGFLELDGLRIDIRKWHKNDPTKFGLVRFPPKRWIGATVTVAPGCTKKRNRCEEWDNLQHFGGIGRAMPNRNPILESGGNE